MDPDHMVERFERLSERYDALHRPGAWLDVKNELSLGSGPFNDHLTPDEVEALTEELADRLESTA